MLTHKTSKLMLRQRQCSIPYLTRNKTRDIRHVKIANTKYIQTYFHHGSKYCLPSPYVSLKPAVRHPYASLAPTIRHHYASRIHTSSNLSQDSGKDSPYWFENEPQKSSEKKKFFNLKIPKFNANSSSPKVRAGVFIGAIETGRYYCD